MSGILAARIGISGVVREWDGIERTGVNAAYVRAVLAAGAVPLILSPLVGDDLAGCALEGLDGLLLSGGEDVDPALYGDRAATELWTPSRGRDRFELALFREARRRGLPILGVCRGIQLINVALGGTLYQDLPSQRPGPIQHLAPGGRGSRAHRVRLEPDSQVALALGDGELVVNSIHHQAIRELAPGLRASGWAEDGLIEAVEGASDAPWLLAVQWHPEELCSEDAAPEPGVFRALAEAALVNSQIAEGAIGGRGSGKQHSVAQPVESTSHGGKPLAGGAKERIETIV